MTDTTVLLLQFSEFTNSCHLTGFFPSAGSTCSGLPSRAAARQCDPGVELLKLLPIPHGGHERVVSWYFSEDLLENLLHKTTISFQTVPQSVLLMID